VNGPANGVWRRGDGSNLVGVPTSRLASAAFNEEPTELRIAGVRSGHGELFRELAATGQRTDAAAVFARYMLETFGLAPPAVGADGEVVRRRYRASYLRLLRGWSFDANGCEGAVLKGWVESRFGLVPTFHKEPIAQYGSRAWLRYVEEKMSSRFHNNVILMQLDLVYEFAQWVLGRYFDDGSASWTLFRGVNDFSEHQIVERLSKKVVVLRLNNLVSFSRSRDVATCFGDYILEAIVPFKKIFVFNGLLEHDPLKGENEVLVIGGDYRITAAYY
jgi:NAD+--dinitrogen-reductase ADP-D-ribosyltransferase